MKKIIIFYVVMSALCGCVPPLTPEQKAEQQAMIEKANEPITCKKGKDCERKWSRAIQWVVQNSSYKIQTQSDNLIQTFSAINDDTNSGFVITKYADGNHYVIDFKSGCDNFIGCIPNAFALKASFRDFIEGK